MDSDTQTRNVKKRISWHLLRSKISVNCNFLLETVTEDANKTYGRGGSIDPKTVVNEKYLEHIQAIIFREIDYKKSDRSDPIRSSKVRQLEKLNAEIDLILGKKDDI